MTANPKGFTLIELLVVIAIVGLLASIVVGSVGSSRPKARDAQRLTHIRSIANALELYYSVNGNYPITDTCAHIPTGFLSFDADYYSSNKVCVGASEGASTLSQAMAPHIGGIKDPKTTPGGDGGYLYYSASNGTSYCLVLWRVPEDMRNYPTVYISDAPGMQCGTIDANGQCSNGTNFVRLCR